ncbi:hypothetical protein F4780DRAFT_488999 [Xylariomycetidae sp. FL0641]|nr:hypothetical protein F4780DRAFT_488999 [Xylariomycetidae sp. FL0641]
MAVLNSVPGIEVAVQVNGQDLTEHDDPHASKRNPPRIDSRRVCTKYIESIDDATFRVRFKATDGYAWGYKDHSLKLWVYADGKYFSGRICNQSEQTFIEGRRSYDEASRQYRLQRFRFFGINAAEQSEEEAIENVKSLGQIQVKVYRTVVVGPKAKSTRKLLDPAAGLPRFSQKALISSGRSVSHGTRFSEAEQTKKYLTLETSDLEEDNGPIAIFRFYYGSGDALKQDMVIPRSPSPAPNSTVASNPLPSQDLVPLQTPSVPRNLSPPVSLDSLPVTEVLRLAHLGLEKAQMQDIMRLAEVGLQHERETKAKYEVDHVPKREADDSTPSMRVAKRPAREQNPATIDLTVD